MYPGHNPRGVASMNGSSMNGSGMNGSGVGHRLPMAHQMVPGINVFSHNPAPNPMQYQHGGMGLMMPMGTNYKWPMMMPQYGTQMMQQMYNNQAQMPMYNSTNHSASHAIRPVAPATTTTGSSMKLPTIVCQSEEPRMNIQSKPSSARRPSNQTNSSNDRNQGRLNTVGPAAASSCNSSLPSDPCYVPLQQALSMIEADKKKFQIKFSLPQSNPGVSVVRSPVWPVTTHVSSADFNILPSSSSNTTLSAFNPIISNITSLSQMPLKVMNVRSVSEKDSGDSPPNTTVNEDVNNNATLKTLPTIQPSSTKATSFILKSPTHMPINNNTQINFIPRIGNNPPTTYQIIKVICNPGNGSVQKIPVKSVVIRKPASNCSKNPLSHVAAMNSNVSLVVTKSPESFVGHPAASSVAVSGTSLSVSVSSPLPVSTNTACKVTQSASSTVQGVSSVMPSISSATSVPADDTPVSSTEEMQTASLDVPETPCDTTANKSKTAKSKILSKSGKAVVKSPSGKAILKSPSVIKASVSSRHRKNGSPRKVRKSQFSPSISDGLDPDDFVINFKNTTSYRYQHQSDMILTAISNVDIPWFLSKIQGYGRRVYRRLLKQLPDVFLELSKDFIYLEDESRYSCIKCYFVSPRIEKALEHVLAHYGPMICKICNKAFIKKCDEDRHMDAHKFGRITCKTPRFLPECLKGEDDEFIHHLLPLDQRISKIEPELQRLCEENAKENHVSVFNNENENAPLSTVPVRGKQTALTSINDNNADAQNSLNIQSPPVTSPSSYQVTRRLLESCPDNSEIASVDNRGESGHPGVQSGVTVTNEELNARTESVDCEHRVSNESEFMNSCGFAASGVGRLSSEVLSVTCVSSACDLTQPMLSICPMTAQINAGLGNTYHAARLLKHLARQQYSVDPKVSPGDTAGVLEITPIESHGSLTTHYNTSDKQAPLRNITNFNQSCGAFADVSQSDNPLVITPITGSYRNSSPRTEIHDSAPVIVISPCSSPTIKTEPIDSYWTTNGHTNASYNQPGIAAFNPPVVSTWTRNNVPPLPSLMTWAQNTIVHPRVSPRPPMNIPPPPPLTSVQTAPGLQSNPFQNVIMTSTASQVIPVAICVPNLLPVPKVTITQSRVSARTQSGEQEQCATSASTGQSAASQLSQNSTPAPVVRNSSAENTVVGSAPLISQILSSTTTTDSESQPIDTTNTQSTTGGTEVSYSANATIGVTSVLPLPGASSPGVLPTTTTSNTLTIVQSTTTSAPSTTNVTAPVTADTDLPNLAAGIYLTTATSSSTNTVTISASQMSVSQPAATTTVTNSDSASLAPRPRTTIPHERMFLACQLCQYVAQSANALERHYNAHSKNQVCRFCNKAFEKKGKLRSHENQHFYAGDVLPSSMSNVSATTQAGLWCEMSQIHTSQSDAAGSPSTAADSSSVPCTLPSTSSSLPCSSVPDNQPGASVCQSPSLTATSETQPTTEKQSESQNSTSDSQPPSSNSSKPKMTNLPFRIDNFTNSVLTETNLYQCRVNENNEIFISLTPFMFKDTSADLIKECPPVASMMDISEIMEGVKKAEDPVDVKVIEIIMPETLKSKKRKKDSSDVGSKKKKKKKLLGYLKLEKKKKKKSKGKGLYLDGQSDSVQGSSTPTDGLSIETGDGASSAELPGAYVADPVHYDTLTDNESSLLSPKKSQKNGQQATPEKAGVCDSAGPAGDVTSPGKYKCTTCNFSTDTKLKMKAHQKAHEMNLQMCEFCYKTFFKMADLVRHVESVHKQALEKEKSNVSAPGSASYCCDCCDYQTDLYARFKMHQNLHKTGQNICQWCGKAFFNIEHLVRHWFTHNIKDSCGQYTCTLCQYKVKEKQQMFSHMTRHYKEKPQNTSKLSFPSTLLPKTKRSKIKDGAYCCPECSAPFALPSLLAWHRRKVHNIVSLSTYKCHSCDVSYTSQWKLKKHISEFHKTSEQNVIVPPVRQDHACTICDRRFASPSYLSRHAVIHSGEKPHKCKTCNKRFTYNHHLNMHQRKCSKPKVSKKKSSPPTNKESVDIKLGDVLKLNTSNAVCLKQADAEAAVAVLHNDNDDDDVIFLDMEAVVPETLN